MSEETLGLTRKSYSHLMEALNELITDYSIEEIVLFGSRAGGNYKHGSDIDLAFKGEKLSHKDIGHFLYFLEEEIPIPYHVDVTHLNHNYVEKKDQLKVLKSSVIFGPNNTGKSTFVKALQILKRFTHESDINDIFIETPFRVSRRKEPIEFSIQLVVQEHLYEYCFSFIQKDEEKYLKEEYLKKDEEYIFRKTDTGSDAQSTKQQYKNAFEILGSNDNLFLPILAKANNKDYIDSKNVLDEIRKIVIIEATSEYGLKEKSVNLLENENPEFIRSLMKYSDLSIDEITYEPDTLSGIDDFDDSDGEEYLDKFKKSLAVTAKHKSVDEHIKVPLMFTESLGTTRLFNLAGEIYDALVNNKVVVIDEIDNSFHTILTRNLFNLFHMSEKTEGQLIATTHDLLLLENEFLFRKDQIWFTDKEEDIGYLYTLDEFGKEEGYREKESAFKDYMKDHFGALPNIDIVSVLENLEGSGT